MLLRKLESFWCRPWVYPIVLALLAAATPLTFAPYYHFWLMPLLFGGFIRLLELTPNRQLSGAYWFGLVAYTTQFYWVHTALHDVSGLPNLYAIPLTLLLPAYLALYPLLAVWAWRKFSLPRIWSIGVVLPILWTLSEFARERILTGFGWGALGYSQIADYSPLAGFAPLGGIHLVTLVTALCGAWLVLIVDNRIFRQRIVFIVLLTAILISGHIAKQTDFTKKIGKPIQVALIQGNIAQGIKFDSEQILPTMATYYRLISQTDAPIVMLPETAVPIFLQDIPYGWIAPFAELAQRKNQSIAFGVAQYTADRQGYLNAVTLLEHLNQGEQAPFYAKNHLVPFGEYKPLPTLTTPLYRMMNMPLSDFQRGGNRQQPLNMHNQKVAFNICYEDGFGDELIPSAAQSTFLANASNMAWYGRSNAMYQQLQQSQARSLELGRYSARATNTGVTAIVDNKGHITAQAPTDTATTLSGSIQGYTGETPYMKLGSSYPLILLLATIATILYLYSRKISRNCG